MAWWTGSFKTAAIAALSSSLRRALARPLSCVAWCAAYPDGTDALPAHRVSLVDERGEVAVMLEGQPQMEVGCHTDVMDSCPKSVAIPMLLRSANPHIIAVDEITQARDLAAMEEAAYCGVRFLATLHADSADDLQRRPLLQKLQKMHLFEKAITIHMADTLRRYTIRDL